MPPARMAFGKGARLADDFISYIDVVFNRPVYADNAATLPLTPVDLNLVFDAKL